MYSITVTRVRPNTEVQFLGKVPETDGVYYKAKYAEVSSVTSSLSEDKLTLTILRTSNTREVLESFKNEFSNTDSPMYVRTQYDLDNGIVTTFSDINTVG